jgi:hypothetical protein
VRRVNERTQHVPREKPSITDIPIPRRNEEARLAGINYDRQKG